MVKPNVQTKLWNSTSESSATINKITGIPCYHLPSLPITTLLARLLAYPHSSRTRLRSPPRKKIGVKLGELHQELKAPIAEAQLRYQGPADLRRMSAPPFKVGQQAFVKAKFFRSTRPSAKLSDKFLGPFDIIARTGSHSVSLRHTL